MTEAAIPPAAVSTVLRAAIDRVIPADDWPSGWDGGVGAYLDRGNPELAWAWPLVDALAIRLEAMDFVGLSPTDQDAALASIDDDPETSPGFGALRRLCWEGFYAARREVQPAGLAMIGFRPVPEGVTPVESVPVPTIPVAQVRTHYDAVVIGSGPGGGSVARAFSEAGKEVLVIERSARRPNAQLRGDHLHDKRNAVYAPSAGPGTGHPRMFETDAGEELVDGDGDAALYGLNAMLFGGGTRIWQGMAWRFMPEDFAMATTYGNPEGAALADWPVDYAEMEPYYAKAERELGVAGEEGALTTRTPRTGGYPMPAMGTERAREVLARGAERLGWGWGPIPLALNSVAHDGRPACVRCPQCVGHACPVDAKNGAHNTVIPRAVASGHASLLLDAEAIRVNDGVHGASVSVMAEASGNPVPIEIGADVVIVSAGAVETPRLLMASGLGNDQLGRYLHDHRVVTIMSKIDPPAKPYVGPGHSIATRDHEHARTIPWGGGVMVDLMGILPLTMASDPPTAGVPRWGAGHKEWMRDGRRNVFGVFGIGQETPLPTSRVTLVDGLRDRWGTPAARLRKDTHPASLQVEEGMAAVGVRWLESSGASDITRRFGRATASAAGEHSSGTARMGDDATTSATGPDGRVHGAHRVFVADASLHPSNGSVNPALTVMANSFRVADRILADWPR